MFQRGNKGLLPPSMDSFPSTKFRVTRPTFDYQSLKLPYIFRTSLFLHIAQFQPSSTTASAFIADLLSPSNTQFLSGLMNFVGRYSVVSTVTKGEKRKRHGVDRPPPSTAEVKERVELDFYSPSEPSWSVLGGNLPFTSWTVFLIL